MIWTILQLSVALHVPRTETYGLRSHKISKRAHGLNLQFRPQHKKSQRGDSEVVKLYIFMMEISISPKLNVEQASGPESPGARFLSITENGLDQYVKTVHT